MLFVVVEHITILEHKSKERKACYVFLVTNIKIQSILLESIYLSIPTNEPIWGHSDGGLPQDPHL